MSDAYWLEEADAFVPRTVLAEHGWINPVEVRRECRAADHVAPVGRLTVGQER